MTMLETKKALEEALYNENPLPFDAMINCYAAVQNYLERCGNGVAVVRNEKYGNFRCPRCNKVVYRSEHYCSQCGNKLDWRI